jgi:hypothetical protein
MWGFGLGCINSHKALDVFDPDKENSKPITKKINIKLTELRIKNITALDVVWDRNNLTIPDSYGGPSRSIAIDSYIEDDKIYLRTVEQLCKREFEEIFGFSCGGFVSGKIIALPLSCVEIY